MQIALASDHAGFEYKERLKLILIESGHEIEDYGTHSPESCDYPLLIRPAALAVANGEADRGIIFGGSGNGEAIVANRVPGIRCTICWNLETARAAREHNDANVLSIGQRMIDFEDVLAIVECWLETPFAGGRHLRRIRQIDRPSQSASVAADDVFPHRAELVDEATYVCDLCRQEFRFPVDISDGSRQQSVETCPICNHEHALVVTVDPQGQPSVTREQRVID